MTGLIATALTWTGLSKRAATLIELALIATALVGLGLYLAHLKHRSDAYGDLLAEQKRLESKYACKQPLEACLAARDALAAGKQSELQDAALRQRAWVEQQNLKVFVDSQKGLDAIEKSTAQDGPVPPIMREQWDRERAARGVR